MAQKKEPLKMGPMRWLKQVRDNLGLSIYGLAAKVGLKIQTLSRLEKSGQGCRMSILSDIRKVSGLSWNQIGALIDAEVEDMRENGESDRNPHLTEIAKQKTKERKKKLE